MKHLEKFNFFDIFKKKKTTTKDDNFDLDDYLSGISNVIDNGIDVDEMIPYIKDCFANIEYLGTDVIISTLGVSTSGNIIKKNKVVNRVLPEDIEIKVEIKIRELGIKASDLDVEIENSISHLTSLGLYVSSDYMRKGGKIIKFIRNGRSLLDVMFGYGETLDSIVVRDNNVGVTNGFTIKLKMRE